MSFEKVEIGPCTLILGDCLEVMKTLPENSIDAVVTDPPAGIAFMNLAFDQDHGGREHWIRDMTVIFAEMKRVTKPGGHAFVWTLPRTSHWTATALEDAGWVVREKMYHIFSQGFPKSLDVSKQLDRLAGKERQVVGISRTCTGRSHLEETAIYNVRKYSGNGQVKGHLAITAPATDAAKQFSGFGTATKPCVEEWILVRKPLSEKTVAENVLKHGTGGLNIDGCRVKVSDMHVLNHNRQWGLRRSVGYHGGTSLAAGTDHGGRKVTAQGVGRWPANLVLSHHPLCEQVGTKKVKTGDRPHDKGNLLEQPLTQVMPTQRGTISGYADADGYEEVAHWQCVEGCAIRLLDEQDGGYPDGGNVSRFFYCPKPSQSERGKGNTHPTTKPLSLLCYLARLITPPGGTILDPFFGSGSTGVAATLEGFHCIGIEKERPYFDMACRRLEQATAQPDMFFSQPDKPPPQLKTPKQEELWRTEP